MRSDPPFLPAPTVRRSAKEEPQEYRFLTYVFGGGVRIREHRKLRDELTPVRGASIRGQLRFWWRACNPGGCETLAKLRAREAEIWGATSAPSRVTVEVIEQPKPPQEVAVYREGGGVYRGMEAYAYGAFPLQPAREARDRRPGVLFDYRKSSFSLRLTYPRDLAADVQEALWAWEAFGGLGARTRRGFGAVHPTKTPVQLREVKSFLARLETRPRIPGVPSLAGARMAFSETASFDALDAWKTGLDLLRRIRQGPGFGRNHGQEPRRPGRSRWPEPDEIRRLTGAASSRHDKPEVSVRSFPRAAFGMPIVFHFKDSGDPSCKPLELRPKEFERFASPLLLRPVADGQKFRTLAVVLSSEPPAAQLLAGKKSFPVETGLDSTTAAQIPALVRGQTVFTDPIALFLWELQRC